MRRPQLAMKVTVVKSETVANWLFHYSRCCCSSSVVTSSVVARLSTVEDRFWALEKFRKAQQRAAKVRLSCLQWFARWWNSRDIDIPIAPEPLAVCYAWKMWIGVSTPEKNKRRTKYIGERNKRPKAAVVEVERWKENKFPRQIAGKEAKNRGEEKRETEELPVKLTLFQVAQ